jgi:hypothetical protein
VPVLLPGWLARIFTNGYFSPWAIYTPSSSLKSWGNEIWLTGQPFISYPCALSLTHTIVETQQSLDLSFYQPKAKSLW